MNEGIAMTSLSMVNKKTAFVESLVKCGKYLIKIPDKFIIPLDFAPKYIFP